MISTKTSMKVLPNFAKTVLFAAAAATSVSAFAGDHKKGEHIGELKDMKKKEAMLKEDEMTSSLTDGDALKSEMKKADKKMDDKVKALKAEKPEG